MCIFCHENPIPTVYIWKNASSIYYKLMWAVTWFNKKYTNQDTQEFVGLNWRAFLFLQNPENLWRLNVLAFLLRGEIHNKGGKDYQPVVYHGAFQLCSTVAEALFSIVFLIKLATWLLAGPFGSGSRSRDCVDAQIEDTSDVGLQDSEGYLNIRYHQHIHLAETLWIET